MITTISSLPPAIIQRYNKFLLMTSLERMQWDYTNKIIVLAVKKLKNCPGRQREFDKLMHEWETIYGIKEIEEANYKSEMQEKIKKRSYIPTTSEIMPFKRIRS